MHGSVIQPIVVVRGNEMVLVILGLLSSISTSISDLDSDSFKMLINSICGLNISWARDEHEGRGISTSLTPVSGHLASPFTLAHALDPSGLGHAAHSLVGLRNPPVSRRRQLARQVGACCVLTNSFPSSSRWVVSSNLSSLGRCSVSRVSSSCQIGRAHV